MTPVIEVTGVSVSFNGTRALADVSVGIERGSWVCLIGPNGAGKTTLLRAFAGLVSHAGTIRLDGVPVGELRRRDVSRRVAVVPQNPVIPLGMKVMDYVLMGRTPYISYLGMESARDNRIASSVLDQLELVPFASRPLASLSGGELQRVILGKALAQQAPILLLDEPTSALDVGHQQQVLELVEDLRREHDLTVISAMHDLTLAGQFADRLVLFDSGRVVAAGTAREVLTEAAIQEHYGASVHVHAEPDGTVAVIPRRTAREKDRDEGSGR
jgi:iron complex transport system ATP-binding protein